VRLTRAFAGERWWVFTLVVGLVAVLVAVAYALSARRDLGASLMPPRPGPATAAAGLRSPLALAWRLHRGGLLAWGAGAVVFGFLLGTVGQSISKFVDNPQMRDWAIRMGARDAGDAFLFMVMYILGQVIAAYAIATALRMRSEETEGRADPVLATAVSRTRWATSHLFFAILGPAALLACLAYQSRLATD
jgi:ABC-2 type transport system permease protein